MIARQALNTLFHLGNEHQKLMDKLYNPETGEIDESVDEQLNAVTGNAHDKCVLLATYMKLLEQQKMQIEFYKQEIAKREAAYDKEIDKFNHYLKFNMERNNLTQLQTPLFTVKIKTNPYSTDITDASKIPEKFIRTTEKTTVTKSPDKNAIKEEVLKTNVQIPGAHVSQKTHLQILTDKI